LYAEVANEVASLLAMTKLVKKPNSNSKPEWAAAVARLRHTQGQNQEAFGKKFHCSPMAVSRWERGVSQPPAQTYLEMGNMAGDPLCWYFWGRAGLSREDVMRVLPQLRNRLQRVRMPHLEIVTAGSGGKKRIQKTKLELVAIPLLKTFAASHGEVGDGEAVLVDAQIESMIAAPREWCPNPATTSCLRVRGDSMSPLIHDGYIVAVDSGQTDVADLNGKIVIAWHRDKGLTVSRLRQFDHTVVLQSENISYESITLSGKQKWKIVAKVLWWIGKAP
jgi:SOS-response transcriptional repressor LexA/DNA-binding transcriptional regulator YiaG